MNGIVRRVHDDGQFAFVEGLTGKPFGTGNPMVFLHRNACKNGILPPVGAEVKFQVVRGEKGPQAAACELVRVRLPRNEADCGKSACE